MEDTGEVGKEREKTIVRMMMMIIIMMMMMKNIISGDRKVTQ